MPDEHTPRDPDADSAATPPETLEPSQLGDTRAEALLGGALPDDGSDIPPPTVLANLNPGDHSRSAQTAQMSGGGGIWQPPTVEEAARLFPNYEVLSLLGRGGMGAVYKARQIELDRLVAIKLLPLEISADPDFADRFRREARAMAKLSHPNIITVHDFGTTSAGHLYFAMEFIEGANLHQIIHGPGLAPAQALGIIIGVCEALAYAHSKGVVHRDIKPANVMVSTDGQVKVADFGLARLTDPTAAELGHTMTGTVMGTPDYMAPEQMRGMNVDHRADIYSLGVMLYEMLCKDVPRGFFEPPSVRAGVDARVDEVVKRAMQQQPERRYQQTGEMKADVAQIHTAMVAPTPSLVAAVQGEKRTASAAGSARSSSEMRSEPAFDRRLLYIAATVLLAVIGAAAYFTNSNATKKPLVQSLTAAAPAKIEPGAITLFDAPEKVPQREGIRWEDNAMRLDAQAVYADAPLSRDAIVRATIRANTNMKSAQIGLRAREKQSGFNFYALILRLKEQTVMLNAVEKGVNRTLHEWPLPHAYGNEDWARLELKAVGEELTASVDGKVLGTVRDSTSLAPGSAFFFATASGFFRDIVYLPLDQPASPAAPAASPAGADGWQPLITASSRPPHSPGQREWNAQRLHLLLRAVNAEAPYADGAIRARIQFQEGSRSVGIIARLKNTGEGYKLTWSGRTSVFLNALGAGGKILVGLGQYDFPKPLAPGETVTLELRAQGDRLTGLVNGTAVIEARDTRYPDAGTWGILADDGWFETAEFQPLATMATGQAPRLPAGNATPPAGGAAALRPAAPEPWREWIAENRRGGKLPSHELEDDGTYVQARGAKGGPAIKSNTRDGAIRVTWKLTGPIGNVGQREPSLALRHGGTLTPPMPGSYTLVFARAGLRIDLHTVDAAGKPGRIELKSWPLPPGFDRTREHTLEFRAVGDELSARLDGQLIGTHRDTRLTEGGFSFFPADGALIRRVEYLSLDPAGSSDSPTSPSAPNRDEKWRDWIAEKRAEAKLASFGFTDEAELVRSSSTFAPSWPSSKPDGAIRATWLLPAEIPAAGHECPALHLRGTKGGRPGTYVAQVTTEVTVYHTHVSEAGGVNWKRLGRWPLPAGFDRTREHTMEFRVVGDLLSVSLNGALIGSVRDSAVPAGNFGFGAAPGLAIRKVEYLSLDPASSGAPAPAQGAAAEKWQDLIAAGGWRAPWTIENGILTRPAKTMAQRKWEASVRDCAWRVTRRWDGGWYDLQLGLRSRGNTGVRLEFLDLPQPDVILVRITSNKQKLAEGKTTRRYQKGDIITIEFRAVGTRITASIDGELLATAEDQTTTSGAYDIWTNYGDAPAFHKVEFLNLDPAP